MEELMLKIFLYTKFFSHEFVALRAKTCVHARVIFYEITQKNSRNVQHVKASKGQKYKHYSVKR